MYNENSCYLIGEDHLVIQCGEILIAENFLIAGVFSPLNEAKHWAEENNIPYYSSYERFQKLLLKNEVDYLFSIVNSKIIPDSILKNIKKLAINYHDGPLPKYGGANATGFSILNKEINHGVTWHIINNLIDGGNILKQAFFNIDDEETTLSLNIKCYQHGLFLFKDLVKELSLNTWNAIPQNLNNRSYHRLEDKPHNNGWLSWATDAKDIERASRAFNMGNYKNKFCTLKFIINEDAYIILDLKITNDRSNYPPGTISDISNDYWKISTKTYDLLLLDIASICGKKSSLKKISADHHIKIGSRFLSPTEKEGLAFKKISEVISKNEPFWLNVYRDFHQGEFPFLELSKDIIPSKQLKIVSKIKLTKKLLEKINQKISSNDDYVTFFVTVFMIYLYKIGNKNNNGVILKQNNDVFFLKNLNVFISEDIPFNVYLNDEMSFNDAFISIQKLREKLNNKCGFLKDIFLRYPELHELINSTPITIITDDSEISKYAKSLIFKISLKNKELSWFIDEEIINNIPFLNSTTKNISAHFSTLLDSILTNTRTQISDLEYMSLKEKYNIFYRWNKTKKEYPETKTIHEIISNIANTNPKNSALLQNGITMSYEELEQKSNQLSNYLLNNSFKQKYIIVHLDKVFELIIAILGILKAGSTYIPIPISSPLKNIESIITDSQAPLLLTKERFSKQLNTLSSLNIKIICIDSIWPLVTKESALNPNLKQSENDIAYIIYTSGTTGVPKGVMIKHKGLVNLILDSLSKLRITKKTRLLQFASISFDASIWEIFNTLAAGATLYLPHQEELLVGNLLKKTIEQNKINFILLPPSILQTIANYSLPSLKTIVTGGEYCSKELANHLSKHKRIINAYGPTEATVCVSMAKIPKNIKTNPPIGKPIANTELYILDKNLKPLPVGIIGELYIAGDSIAEGYLNKKKLTEKFFIKNPYSNDGNLYRTRDLVRWLPNGEIDYIGRVDNQIKIRGFRVELEAIETQILHYPNISQCAVVVQENKNIGKHLVGYISFKNNKLDIENLREHLKNTLPQYMIPSFFMSLEKLPISNNGKIDRKKLPKFDPNTKLDLNTYKSPRSILEQRLTEIWSELLNISTISINDSFFDLGGHSLIITNLSTYLIDEFNYTLSLQHFFKLPTIENLSKLIENKDTINNYNHLHESIPIDKLLSPEIKPLTQKNININSILITGATGFLGIHLLNELLNITEANLYCLIRAESPRLGLDRIQKELIKYQMNTTKFDRINIICGDLSKPKLGLNDITFNFLAKEIDLIYHNGAHIHHLYDYDLLRSSNVQSTLELIKLSTLSKNKSIHYISSLSAIIEDHLHNNLIPERFINFEMEVPKAMNGYNQTKLISEYLLSQAKNRNIEVNIYRPGWIMGQHTTGLIAPENNHLLLLLKGCIQLGIAPNWDIALNILPVNFLSQFIVKVSLEMKLRNKVYNISNNSLHISWVELIDYFNSNGFPIKIISANTWREKIQQITSNNALYNLLSLYRDENALQQQMSMMHSHIDNQNTNIALKHINFNLTFIKNDLLNIYMNFLIKCGFLGLYDEEIKGSEN